MSNQYIPINRPDIDYEALPQQHSNYGKLNKKEESNVGVIIFIGLLVLAIIISIIFIALHFTCTWSLFDTTQCLCEKHGGTWDDKKSPNCTFPDPTKDTPKCDQICQNGGRQLADCSCECDLSKGYTGEYCQIFIPDTPIPNPTPVPNPIPSPNPSPIPSPTPSPNPTPIPNPIPSPVVFPTGGTPYMIKAPTSDLYVKTVGGSATGNNQRLDDCKGNPGNCQWIFNPVPASTGKVYNIKASDADLYLRGGGGVFWLANNNWASDPSTQFEVIKGDMTDSFYFRPVSYATKYFAVKGDWEQDAVPAILPCTPGIEGGTPGCQWSLQKMGEW